MKKILGLDLGTTSIGWAYVNEAESPEEDSNIVKLGVRVIPLSTDEETDFQKGKAATINADRTLKRGARRNLDRYQLRRKALIDIMRLNNFLDDRTILSEEGKGTTFSTYCLRSKAVRDKLTKSEIAKVLLMINKKRGYKSGRKISSDDEGVAIDGMKVAMELAEKKITPGQYIFNLLKEGKKLIPDFYPSDLWKEFDQIWNSQKKYYPEVLSDKLKKDLKGKNKSQTWAICKTPFSLIGIAQKGNAREKKLEQFLWRTNGLTKQLPLEHLAIVLQEINNQSSKSSGYLGAISDRSKELHFKNQTIGEYLYEQLRKDPHARLKDQTFYRQDYLDEFEAIWNTQSEFHPELTEELRIEIRDVAIFYQRRLKSQKHLISNCEFEKQHKVVPKSSPLFQEFKIWQMINNVELQHLPNKKILRNHEIELEIKEALFNELNIRDKMSSSEVLKILVDKPSEYKINYKDGLEGNRTNHELYKAYQEILQMEGEEKEFKKLRADVINDLVVSKFAEIGIEQEILLFNNELEGNSYDKQPLMQLWHLLYSFEGDNSRTGDEKLIEALVNNFGFYPEYAKIISKVRLQADHGNLSSRAIRKILPFMKAGHPFASKESDTKLIGACELAGYNHSSSLTKVQLEKRELKNELELLAKNSLRNPVVEKILNQLVNVVNAIINDDTLGKPDEIRIELARELKKNAKERGEMTKNLNASNINHDRIKAELKQLHPFNKGVRVTKNDIIKYKLYEELAPLGHKTIYTNTYVPLEKLFSKEFDIEHIIPKAVLFDDSFSNKTLATRDFNSREKGNKTGIDAIVEKYSKGSDDYNRYIANTEKLFNKGKGLISRAKYNKFIMTGKEIPEGFIERDLRNSQYIAKKAKQMLEEVVRTVNTTTGTITNRLREDWQLVNVMQELNWDKYNKLGLTHYEKNKDGKNIPKITDWTKRNDHRHHAMDALAVAFTSYSHVQYLNNLSARKDNQHEKYHSVYGIEQKYLEQAENGKLLFKPPIPLTQFREEAKEHLENILISFKAKNKVVTRNKNKTKIKGKDQFKTKVELTPRGQLHKETVYGRRDRYETKDEKVGPKFDLLKIRTVANQKEREALLSRLAEFGGDPKKAFGGKNAPAKNPVFIDTEKTKELPEKVKLVTIGNLYTIRKPIAPDLKIDKVIDTKVKEILWQRLQNYGNDPKLAFSNLEENPIWFNREKGICIKNVSITGVSNTEPLHAKKDHNGEFLLSKDGKKQAVDFVSTGNNHHVAVFLDTKGKFQEQIVSFYEVVHRVNAGLSLIDKTFMQKDGWNFLFTLKQNEYFVFPSLDFDPEEIDLLNPENSKLISPHLYRIQKITSKDYFFRHHLETSVDNKKELMGISYKRIGPSGLKGIHKVRINHLGKIVKVGEY